MRRSIPIALALMVLASLSLAAPSAAVCPPIDGWPAFSELVPEARRVVIGTVLETDAGRATRLRVDEILRGGSRRVQDLDRLRARLGREADTCAFSGTVDAVTGDRLAIAFNGKIDGWRGRLDTVALVDAPSGHPNRSGLERLTSAQVRLMLGHEADGSTVAMPRRSRPPADRITSLLRSLPGDLLDLAADLLGYPRGEGGNAE